jgi:hypothetical protein
MSQLAQEFAAVQAQLTGPGAPWETSLGERAPPPITLIPESDGLSIHNPMKPIEKLLPSTLK